MIVTRTGTFLLSSAASCGSIMPPCSRPDQPALLDALRPVFNLSSIRPAVSIKTITNISIEYILYGILGVVRDSVVFSQNNFTYNHIFKEEMSQNVGSFSGWKGWSPDNVYLADFGKCFIVGAILSIHL